MGRRFDVEREGEAKEEKSRKRGSNLRSSPLEVKQSGSVKKEVNETREKQRGDLNLENAYYVPTPTQSFPAIKHLKILPTVVKSESMGCTLLSKLFSQCSVCYKNVSIDDGSPCDRCQGPTGERYVSVPSVRTSESSLHTFDKSDL